MEVPPHYIGQSVKCISCGTEFNVQVATSAQIRVAKSKPKAKPKPVPTAEVTELPTNKRILPAFILAFLLGVFGVHAFYAGQIFQGVIYLLMWFGFVLLSSVGSPYGGILLLCVAVFALSDLIRIVVGAYKDGKGSKITQWT